MNLLPFLNYWIFIFFDATNAAPATTIPPIAIAIGYVAEPVVGAAVAPPPTDSELSLDEDAEAEFELSVLEEDESELLSSVVELDFESLLAFLSSDDDLTSLALAEAPPFGALVINLASVIVNLPLPGVSCIWNALIPVDKSIPDFSK